MERIKCATFDKETQDNIPKEIREKMKADRDKAEKEQKTKDKTLPIQNVRRSYPCPTDCGGVIIERVCNICGCVW